MSFLVELLLEIIFEFLICAPGAFILWACGGFKGSFSNIVTAKQNSAAVVGILFWIAIAAVSVVAVA